MRLTLAQLATLSRSLLRSRSVVLCLMSLALLMPRLAVAAAAVPMSSPHGESIAAPPPESPPTGGEIRDVRRANPEAPTLELGPQREPAPLPWQVPSPDPAVVTLPRWLLVAPAIATNQHHLTAYAERGSLGVRTEVFRPPCAS